MQEGAKSFLVKAYDVAASFDLASLRFQLAKSEEVLERNPLIFRFGGDQYLVVFDYGAAVFINFSDEEETYFLTQLKKSSDGVNRKEFVDSFTLYLGERREVATAEELWVKELTLDAVKLVAIVLSRSVSLEYYEDLIEGKLANLEGPVNLLTSQGKFGSGLRKYVKKFGTVLGISLELAHCLHLLDEPDITWESEEMQKLYDRLNVLFDLAKRSQTVERKLKIIKESCKFIIELQHNRSASIMELAIILLFVIDIVLLLITYKP